MSKVLQGPKVRYKALEKAALAVVFSTRRLRHYFQSFIVLVMTNLPDPACWPRRKNLASSNLDRLCAVLASVLHLDSPREPAKDRMAPLRPITLRRPSQRLNHQNTKRKLRTGTMQNSLSAYSSSRKRKRSNLKRAYLRSSLESLIYLCTFSLLTVTHLDTWLASSCTRVTIWSILDLGATSYSSGFWLSYLYMKQLSA